jgi:predicted kinase
MIDTEMVILTGNVGSGKSLIASKYAKNGYVVINADSLTTSLHGGEYDLYDPNKKEIYHSLEYVAIKGAFFAGYSVVVDRTNMKRSDRARYISLGKEFGAKIISITWGPGTIGMLDRRIKGSKGRPENRWLKIYEAFYKSYEPPNGDEGFSSVMKGPTAYKFYAYDFDGTLVENRFPQIGLPIRAKIKQLREKWRSFHNIIIIWTCRSGQTLYQMKDYLISNKIPFDFINENPLVNHGSPKIYANEYHDDRNAPK